MLLVLLVVARAAAPEMRPPLPDVALAVVMSLPVAVTSIWAVVAPAPGADRLTLSPTEAIVVLLDTEEAAFKPAATIPIARPETLASWLVSLVALTEALPVKVRMLLSPTRPATSVVFLALDDVAEIPANSAPEAPLATAEMFGSDPSRSCDAEIVRLRPVMAVLSPR